MRELVLRLEVRKGKPLAGQVDIQRRIQFCVVSPNHSASLDLFRAFGQLAGVPSQAKCPISGSDWLKFRTSRWRSYNSAKIDVPLPTRASDALYPVLRNGRYRVKDRTLTPARITGRYNNFYEFTTDKAAVAPLASGLTIDPWTIEIGDLVQKPFRIGFEDLVKKFPLEERIYRLRSFPVLIVLRVCREPLLLPKLK